MNRENEAAEFSDGFDSFVCDGDTIKTEVDGITYEARIVYDSDSGIDDDDCHNKNQSVTGCNDEQYMKLMCARESWFEDEWFYCGIIIKASKLGIIIDHNAASLWGIEANYPGSDNSYLTDVANELLSEAIEGATKRLDYMIADLQR